MPYDEYVRVLQTSKITLNFSMSGQLKGRVFEALHCGALLMEIDGTEITRYFRPGIEYVVYRDPADLADKIRYYLAHEEERAQIAAQGHDRAVQCYGSLQWWHQIWERIRELAHDQLQDPLRFVW